MILKDDTFSRSRNNFLIIMLYFNPYFQFTGGLLSAPSSINLHKISHYHLKVHHILLNKFPSEHPFNNLNGNQVFQGAEKPTGEGNNAGGKHSCSNCLRAESCNNCGHKILSNCRRTCSKFLQTWN